MRRRGRIRVAPEGGQKKESVEMDLSASRYAGHYYHPAFYAQQPASAYGSKDERELFAFVSRLGHDPLGYWIVGIGRVLLRSAARD